MTSPPEHDSNLGKRHDTLLVLTGKCDRKVALVSFKFARFLNLHTHQDRRALGLNHPGKSRLVLLAADVGIHQESKADSGGEEVVQDSVDPMPLHHSHLLPVFC